MKKISVIGAGHVGLVTAAGFARLGHRVLAVDHDRKRIETLLRGEMPFYEPGLGGLVAEGVAGGKLSFSTSIDEAVEKTGVIFVCVGTPTGPDGSADLSAVEAVISAIAARINRYRLIIEKSTVPALTGEWVKSTMKRLGPEGVEFDIAASPEFLREGSALENFFQPDRIVVGTETEKARRIMAEIYEPFETEILFTDIKSAELIKHASNSFLALKISYINAISRICEQVGADVNLVARGMGLDRRIGPAHLRAGIGYGGSCFPKDVAAFLHLSREIGYDFKLLEAVDEINRDQKKAALRKIKGALWNLKGKKLAVFGLAFKGETDDTRESPSLELIDMLLAEGAKISAWDPAAGQRTALERPEITVCRNPKETARGAEALLVLTEWAEFEKLDFAELAGCLSRPLLFDGRGFLPREKLEDLGFTYLALGRP